jgi:hypothetical protein
LFGEDARTSLNISVALAPTLIFTLVLATILRERYAIPESWYGGLLVYAAVSTMLPTLILAKPFDIDVIGPPLPGFMKNTSSRVEETAGSSRASEQASPTQS